MAIKLIKTSAVCPAKPTERHQLMLSSFDAYWLKNNYARIVYFYKPCPDPSEAMAKLKQSLSQALVHYYPWSGRVAVDGQNHVVIDCNDAGVEFVEAKAEGVALLELERTDFQIRPWFDELCRYVDINGEEMYKCPLMSVQATVFADGSLALGLALSHVVADGNGMVQFLFAWTACANGREIPSQPVHDRQLAVLQEPASLEKASKWSIFPSGEHIDPKEDHARRDTVDLNGDALMQCVLQFPGKEIRRLKSTVNGECTSYEAACAHLWQRVTAASGVPTNGKVIFGVVADIRAHFTPPLPAAYCGNAIVFRAAISCAGDVASPDKLGDTAARIREAVRSATKQEMVEGFLHRLELEMDVGDELWETGIFIMYTSSSPKFGVYEVDVGWGSRPVAFRSLRHTVNGEMFMMTGRPGCSSPGDMEICAVLHRSVMRRLLNDPLFLAKPRVSAFDLESRSKL